MLDYRLEKELLALADSGERLAESAPPSRQAITRRSNRTSYCSGCVGSRSVSQARLRMKARSSSLARIAPGSTLKNSLGTPLVENQSAEVGDDGDVNKSAKDS
jgi:hypothetical protein